MGLECYATRSERIAHTELRMSREAAATAQVRQQYERRRCGITVAPGVAAPNDVTVPVR